MTPKTAAKQSSERDLSSLNLKRNRVRLEDDFDIEPEPQPVSGGPIDRVVELAFNPSREKIREVTVIDRMQGRLFPIMDTINMLYRHCIEIAVYRQSKTEYKKIYKKQSPEQLDIIDSLMYRTAQWQKSVGGKNLEKATDLALAETETQGDSLPESTGSRGYEE